MTDAWSSVTEPGELSVTIKYGKGYEDTWLVFRGKQDFIRDQIIDVFGMDRASVGDLTLNDLVQNATVLAHGRGAMSDQLGATVTRGNFRGSRESAPAAKEEKPTESPILAQIAAATSVEDLKRLWAENQSAFSDKAVMDAWKARGKALQGAA